MYSDMAKKDGLCSLLSVPMMVRDTATDVLKWLHVCSARVHRRRDAGSTGGSEAHGMSQGLPDGPKKLTGEEVFKLIQWQRMDFRNSMREIAEAVLLAGELDQRVEKHRG
jgi:hypothetical protein